MTGEDTEKRGFIALGSNLGDRRANLDRALILLAGLPGVRVGRVSGYYPTKPVGGPPQPDYLNAACEVWTTLSPGPLLERLLAIEAQLGRVRGPRFGPRTLDLDLLLYEDVEMESESLSLPHPRMAERRFVLEPLAEIAPKVLHPGLRTTVGELLEGVS